MRHSTSGRFAALKIGFSLLAAGIVIALLGFALSGFNGAAYTDHGHWYDIVQFN